MLGLDPLYILLIAIVVFLASYLLVSYLRESSTQKEEKGKLLTMKKCLSCNYVLSRPYEKEDYVGRKEGKCPRCSGDMMITAIYLEPPPQPQVTAPS